MPRRQRPRPQTVFEQNQSLDFARFDAQFQTGLRALVKHVTSHNGAPAANTTTPEGFALGQWLWTIQRNPHVLDISQRAVLLAIPGVRMTTRPTPEPFEATTDRARDYLWQRLRAWAHNPMDDPIYAARVRGIEQTVKA